MGEGYLPDYKVYCFNGELKYILLIKLRLSDCRMAYFDPEWNKMLFSYIYHDEIHPKPINNGKSKHLEDMLKLCQILSKDFAFIHVDWYLVRDSDIYFSEITFTPAMEM